MDSMGIPQKDCKVCGKEIEPDVKEIKIEVKHKDTGDFLASFWFKPPLCKGCGGEGSVSIEIGWEDGNLPNSSK